MAIEQRVAIRADENLAPRGESADIHRGRFALVLREMHHAQPRNARGESAERREAPANSRLLSFVEGGESFADWRKLRRSATCRPMADYRPDPKILTLGDEFYGAVS